MNTQTKGCGCGKPKTTTSRPIVVKPTEKPSGSK